MLAHLPPVSCPYLELKEQCKQYDRHTKRISSARACVGSIPDQAAQYQHYPNKPIRHPKGKDDKNAKIKKIRQPKNMNKLNRVKSVKQIRQSNQINQNQNGNPKSQQIKSARSARPVNWMDQLTNGMHSQDNSVKISPSAVLLFPSPVMPNTKTPETLRQLIDDSGLIVFDESPLSARDPYYAKDIQSLNHKQSHQQFQVRPPNSHSNSKVSFAHLDPSPRPRSMRYPEKHPAQVQYSPRVKIAQSERHQRPELVLDEEAEQIAKQKYEEQKKKFDEFDLDEFDVNKYDVDDILKDADLDPSTQIVEEDYEVLENVTSFAFEE
ncbi:hypothetical protein TRFO_19597 [Tritrichomonas foetus]|uniref:Uncharacterized protein n=1 Tax=Tritrichomonas foetus TaxID=1144522 RepID=A0A1J4KHQ4_9EUKA|nr:hypothetical protein TRFO_19597 [Tritrichomonas foetus]|eukprot:OHT10919.1 hypothetical protein TRFO_19597 [Tritrichomonas foetus]